ncbi:MAG: GNAT family N-acetyltransferase [Planctomycetes bacterium]|nr:GNAT family N-acetyltransferase [Planctomycetota bacterium]
MVTIRPVRPEDRDAVHALLADLGYPKVEAKAFLRVFADILVAEYRSLVVAEADGKILGFLCCTRQPTLRLGGDQLLIDELVVADAARGKGTGKALLAWARDHAKGLGAKRIELHTSRKRDSYTRGFYKKQGFAEADSALFRIEL